MPNGEIVTEPHSPTQYAYRRRRETVESALQNAGVCELSNNAIRRMFQVSVWLVRCSRRKLEEAGAIPETPFRTGRDGRTFDVSRLIKVPPQGDLNATP